MVRSVAIGANGYYGWHLVVKTGLADQGRRRSSPARRSASRRPAPAPTSCARWTQPTHKINFTRVPLGGGGLVPNLLSGNIDASVIYSPLTYKLIIEKTARSSSTIGAAVPPHLTGGWMATDKFIKERPEVLQKALNALYGGLAFLQCDEPRRRDQADRRDRRDPGSIAAAELDGNINKLSQDRRVASRLDGARARHGAPDRHDRPGAGEGHLHRPVQAGADDEPSVQFARSPTRPGSCEPDGPFELDELLGTHDPLAAHRHPARCCWRWCSPRGRCCRATAWSIRCCCRR